MVQHVGQGLQGTRVNPGHRRGQLKGSEAGEQVLIARGPLGVLERAGEAAPDREVALVVALGPVGVVKHVNRHSCPGLVNDCLAGLGLRRAEVNSGLLARRRRRGGGGTTA